MSLIEQNFGFSGQVAKGRIYEYDDFLCLTKKCKEKKQDRREFRKEKKEARIAKKKAKNDQRVADTERVRAETTLVNQSSLESTQPIAVDRQSKKAGGSSVVIVIGALLIGGYLLKNAKQNKALNNT